MNQKAMRCKSMDEWLSVKGSALQNSVLFETPTVNSGSTSLLLLLLVNWILICYHLEMKINAGNLKKGDFVYHQGEIWQVQKADFYSPGKGSALMKTRIKNLISGKNIEYVYKSNEQVETVDVQSIEMQYLYHDNENLYFMDERTYNQFSLPIKIAGDVYQYFKEGEKMYVYLHNDKILTVRPPLSVKLKVVEAEDAVKGDTVSGAKKSVKLETGVRVMVPLFIKVGDIITVNPETGEYTGRV